MLWAAEFFKWEPVSLGQAIAPALFTIIAPGFTEEVCSPRTPYQLADLPWLLEIDMKFA